MLKVVQMIRVRLGFTWGVIWMQLRFYGGFKWYFMDDASG